MTNYTKNYVRTIDKGLTPVHTLIKNFKLTKIPGAEWIDDTNLVLDVSLGGGWIYSWGISVGVGCPTLSRTKKCHFTYPFFRPGLKNIGLFSDLKLLWLERQQKDFLKFISNLHIIILSRSVGNETIASSIRFRGSFEKPFPILPRFQTTTLWGGTYLYSLYKGVPPSMFDVLIIHFTFQGHG